jgi:CubicO group peptidase (beta-lactamase class C family)
MKKALKWAQYGVLGIILVLNIWVLATGRAYIYKTLLYTNADIDDYKIFDNRVVQPGIPQPWPLAKNYNKICLPDSLLQTLKELKTTAFLIIRNDSLLYEKYNEGYGEKSISNSFSVAQSIVNILTGIALKEGKIKSLDEPVGDFLPAFKNGRKSKVTIRHLLSMSSGLNWDESYSSLLSPTTEAYYGFDLEKLISKYDVINEPGTICSYKTIDVQTLSMVLHKATGKSLSDYASEKLWGKIGAEAQALWSLDHKDGDEKAYCCFNAEARDFARIGKLYLDSGKWKNEEIVPREFVLQSTTPNMLKDENGETTDYYGYLWWIINYRGERGFYARGILGQYVIVLPKHNIIIVRLGEKRGNVIINHCHKEVLQMIDAVLDMK